MLRSKKMLHYTCSSKQDVLLQMVLVDYIFMNVFFDTLQDVTEGYIFLQGKLPKKHCFT